MTVILNFNYSIGKCFPLKLSSKVRHQKSFICAKFRFKFTIKRIDARLDSIFLNIKKHFTVILTLKGDSNLEGKCISNASLY